MSATIVVEVEESDGPALAAQLKKVGAAASTVKVRSSSGLDAFQLVLQVTTPIIAAASSVLAAYVARGKTIVVVHNGERKEVSDDKGVAKLLDSLQDTPKPKA